MLDMIGITIAYVGVAAMIVFVLAFLWAMISYYWI